MLPTRSVSRLGLSERQALRTQWLRSGQCVRCFHASARRRADGDGNDGGTPVNAPKRGPTRQQRAAKVSEEVKMLQRDHSSPTFNEPDPNSLRPPGASQTVDPEAVGVNVGSGRMGENDAPTQDGPLAQGVGRPVERDEDVPDTNGLARVARTPHNAVEEPAQGGAGVIDSSRGDGAGEKAARPPEEDEDEIDEDEEQEEDDVPDHDKTWVKPADQQMQSVYSDQRMQSAYPFAQDTPAADELLRGEHSPSTIAGSGFPSVIESRFKTVSEPGQQESFRNPQYLARKLMDGQLVRFVSKQEKAAAEEAAKHIAVQRARSLARWKKIGKDEPQPTPPTHKFVSLPETARTRMFEKLVAGKYDPQGFLNDKEHDQQAVLNRINKMAMKNDTYLEQDGNRFWEKVRSLLPDSKPTQKGGAAPQTPAQNQKAK